MPDIASIEAHAGDQVDQTARGDPVEVVELSALERLTDDCAEAGILVDVDPEPGQPMDD